MVMLCMLHIQIIVTPCGCKQVYIVGLIQLGGGGGLFVCVCVCVLVSQSIVNFLTVTLGVFVPLNSKLTPLPCWMDSSRCQELPFVEDF